MTGKSEQPDAEHAEETPQSNRRRHPRVYENLPADITLADDEALRLPIESIALGGIRLDCSETEMRRIKTGGHPALHGQSVEVGLKVNLPTFHAATETLEGNCRLIYTRRVTQTRYFLGMQFTELKGESYNALVNYLLDAPTTD